jgi:hypothetical protein
MMGKKQEEKQLEEYTHLESVLRSISGFIAKHPRVNYIEFDYYTTHDITLFFVEPNFDFNALKENIDKIIDILAPCKRIFSKPIIALKDSPDVLPVEVVSRINQKTLSYLGNHFNDVDNITNRGVKPRKLLTTIYEDDYGIYENMVFCNFIDVVLSYCRRNLRILRNLLYASEKLEINLLERVNHIDYFLALGKLHTGYIRDFDKYYDISKELFRKIMYILNTIRPRLIKPVYKLNERHKKELELKKTNIFLMQKDYHQVYLTYKYFISHKMVEEKPKIEFNRGNLLKSYADYVELLTIFALGHFGFVINTKRKMSLRRLDVTFKFKKWTINLRKVEKTCILVTVKKERIYKFLLVPSISFVYSDAIKELGRPYRAKEVILCNPFEEDYSSRKSLYISIENIDSFRRLQQLFLKGMVYSDRIHKDCPFCSGNLIYNSKDNSYECHNCWTLIKENICSDTNDTFYTVSIANLKKQKIDPALFNADSRWLYNKKVESAMYFRNITKLDNYGDSVCPICGKIHRENDF